MLDQGDKAEVLGFDILEEAIHFQGMLDVFGVYHTQQIDREFILAQQAIALHHLLVSRFLAFVDAIGVVKSLWAIQAQAHSELFCCKKAAPGIVEQYAIGLDAVGDTPARRLMLAL